MWLLIFGIIINLAAVAIQFASGDPNLFFVTINALCAGYLCALVPDAY